MLLLGRPGNKVIDEEKAIAGGGFLHVQAADSISVEVSDKIVRIRTRQLQTGAQGAFNVLQNMLGKLEMQLAWIMHMQTNLLHNIGDIRASRGEVVKGTSEATVEGQIGHRSANSNR